MNNKGFERIAFLAEKFKVFTQEDFNIVYDKFYLNLDGKIKPQIEINKIGAPIMIYDNKDLLAYYIVDHIDYDGVNIIKDIHIHENVLQNMVQHDPTKNKIYVQWMLTTFVRLIKNDNINEANRFISEDLAQSTEYLRLFEENKNKKMFKKLANKNPSLINIKDISNINQYVNLSQVFDAVEFYIEKDISQLEAKMLQFVKINEAEIPFKDRNFTLYIPKTRNASVIFDNFVSWCTAKSGNSNFNSYTNQKTPFNKNSKLFIIINNNFFLERTHPDFKDELYQLHFESNQIMNRGNSNETDIKEKVLDKSNGLKNYFKDLLYTLGRKEKELNGGTKYLNHLLDFGFSEALFEILNKRSSGIKYVNRTIKTLPNLIQFNNLSFLFLSNVKLASLGTSLKGMNKLGVISLPDNNLTKIPQSICYLKNLTMLNLSNNKIEKLPPEIFKLDKANGGNLIRLVISGNIMSNDYLKELHNLLPNVNIITQEEKE